MKYGCIPIVRDYSLLPGIVTEKNVVLVDESNLIPSVSQKVNEVIGNYSSYTDMIKRNQALLKKYYDRKDNAQKLLNLLEANEKTEFDDIMEEFL